MITNKMPGQRVAKERGIIVFQAIHQFFGCAPQMHESLRKWCN
jgi:hypothetical protein